METWVPIMRSFHLTPATDCLYVCVWVAEWITQDDELGFALDPHSCAGARSHLHAVLHSSLQTPDNHWTDGCIHRLIDMKARFVGQTPDLTTTDTPDGIHWKVMQYITKTFRLLSCIRCRVWFLPCTPGWCRSVGRREEGPMTRWWMCCYGCRPSTLSLAVEVLQVLMGQKGENIKNKKLKINRYKR